MSFEEQMSIVWVVSAVIPPKLKTTKKEDDQEEEHQKDEEKEEEEEEQEETGSAFCFHEDGYLFTAYHVFNRKELQDNIKGRDHFGMEFRKIEFVDGFPTLDIAVLKIIPNFEGERFSFQFPNPQFPLREGEMLVTHGHGAGIPHSSRFGKTMYPYRPLNDLVERLVDLHLTLQTSTDNEVATMRSNFPTPPFRTIGGVVDKISPDNDDLLGFHPLLPLIALEDIGIPSYSGSPVFRTVTGEVVGMLIFGQVNGCTYSVPSDVLSYVVEAHLEWYYYLPLQPFFFFNSLTLIISHNTPICACPFSRLIAFCWVVVY